MIDVTVRGAGIFGLSIAWACIRRGAKVQVVDPHGVGSWSSGGIVGALAPHVPEKWNAKKEFQFESLITAETFWQGVEEVARGSSGYARLGRIQPIPDADSLELAHIRSENAKMLWKGLAEWEVINSRPNFAPPSPTRYWIKDTLSARINPGAACHLLEVALRKRGVRFFKQGHNLGATLWATGIHDLVRISKTLNIPFGSGVKGQAALFDFDRRQAPQLFADSLHFIPHQNGTLAVGSTSERDYESGNSTDEKLDLLITQAQSILPELRKVKVIKRWASVRPRAISRAPILGRHPLDPDAFIANGGFKIGFGMAPKIAEVMADLILGGGNDIPVDFHPEKSLEFQS